MNTAFLTAQVDVGQVSPEVFSSHLFTSCPRTGVFTLAEGATATFKAAGWCVFALRVIGEVAIETASVDLDGSTPMVGTATCYGIAKYPGVFSQVTKASDFELTGGDGGAIVEYFIADLHDDSQL